MSDSELLQEVQVIESKLQTNETTMRLIKKLSVVKSIN